MIDVRRNIINTIVNIAQEPGFIYLYPHVGADGDALGSSLALLLVLEKLGYKARLLVDEPVSPKLRFLPHWERAIVFEEDAAEELAAEQKAALAIDCADADRTGRRRLIFDQSLCQAALDHHISSGESGKLRLIDAGAAAVAEVIADVIRDFEELFDIELMDRDIAALLMTALISDTGRFVYSNTTARSFATAAWLMQFDIDLRSITYNLYDVSSQSRIRLTGRIFTDTEFFYEGRIALAKVDPALLSEYDASEHDLEGIVSQLRNVAGVEASFVLRLLDDGRIKVNIRSSDGFNASGFAREYGGGGHPKAAGMTIEGFDLQSAGQQLIEHARRYLS
jgi:phosphoesterase RecJ-like protein